MVTTIKDDVSIVLAGEAGQGIQAIESIITSLLLKGGYNFFSTSEFMSRVRGGVNSTEIRVASESVSGFLEKIDVLIPLHEGAVEHLAKRITPETVIVGEKDRLIQKNVIDVSFSKLAAEAGGTVFSNTVAAGFICGLLGIDQKECEQFVPVFFNGKDDKIILKNIEAIRKGYEAGLKITDINIQIKKSGNNMGQIRVSGADSVALGALAGGCNYVCGYPMSPSTSVLEKMASYSKKFDIIVEQVEDEVGVVNMAIGAWYAGARAFITTSGGGFALMCEGISLCGMIESPLVLHLAQRPGPATGLPTRTEQGDLNMVLYAGHGDFPRIILAPGTLEDGFTLTGKAFDLADKYQVPVFVLTDQFFVDSSYNTPAFNPAQISREKYIIETREDYKRFALTDSGISPRGIPGYGTGNVCADSDEHDEHGYITEDADVRVSMVNKRRKKIESIRDEILPPRLAGENDYKTLVICWGSTFNTVAEAVRRLMDRSIAVLHFSWIFPVHESAGDLMKKASDLIIVENNSSGQLAQLLQLTTGISITKKILKYNGSPF